MRVRLATLVPLSAKLYLIPEDGTIYVTGGPVLVTAAVDAGPFGDAATEYSVLGSGEHFIWPGLTLGYAF